MKRPVSAFSPWPWLVVEVFVSLLEVAVTTKARNTASMQWTSNDVVIIVICCYFWILCARGFQVVKGKRESGLFWDRLLSESLFLAGKQENGGTRGESDRSCSQSLTWLSNLHMWCAYIYSNSPFMIWMETSLPWRTWCFTLFRYLSSFILPADLFSLFDTHSLLQYHCVGWYTTKGE